MRKESDSAVRKEWIRWMLDFAQMDLNSLRPGNMKALKKEVAYFCSENPSEQGWEEFEENLHLAPVTPGENEGVTEIDDGAESVNLSETQNCAIDFLRALNSIHKSRREDRAIERIFVRHLPEMSSYIVSLFPGTFVIRRHPTKSTPENWLILNFVGLIERFETYPIKKCKGCDRFFLHLTMIKKIYCTSSCAARSIQREKRERLYQDPKKHKTFLNNWRKYQKKRYDEKLKARLGPLEVSRRKRLKPRKED